MKTLSKHSKQHQQLMAWRLAREKSKIMPNKADGFTHKNIEVKDHNLETVTNFKYLGAILTDEVSKREVLARIARAISVLTKVKTVWKDRSITSKHRIQILCSIVTSTFLYACEKWTLTAELEQWIQTFEMLQGDLWHLIQRPNQERRSQELGQSSYWTTR